LRNTQREAFEDAQTASALMRVRLLRAENAGGFVISDGELFILDGVREVSAVVTCASRIAVDGWRPKDYSRARGH